MSDEPNRPAEEEVEAHGPLDTAPLDTGTPLRHGPASTGG